jgi:alanyl-tRNA synthetase
LKRVSFSKFKLLLVALQSQKDGIISGPHAFLLYDTYGFPLEDTVLYAKEKDLLVDLKGYEEARQKGIEASKKTNSKESIVSMKLEVEQVKELKDKNVNLTNTIPIYQWKNSESKVVGLIKNLEFFSEMKNTLNSEQEHFGIILDSTSFYPQQGGQIYDTGYFTLSDSSVKFIVKNVQSFGGYIVHTGCFDGDESSCKISLGDKLMSDVDFDQRNLIASNHTTTHLLNFSLTSILGESTNQQGSDVTSERLRFDFSYNQQIKVEDLTKIQKIVQDEIDKQSEVYSTEMDLEVARKIPGVQALFGEHYPNPVRVISVGVKVEDLKESGKLNSIEFCGGTHLKNTRESKSFVILKEEGISKGTRRILGLTGDASERSIAEAKQFQKSMEGCKLLDGVDFMNKVQELQNEVEKMENIPLLSKHQFRGELQDLFKKGKVMLKDIENASHLKLKEYLDTLREEECFIQDVSSFSAGGRNTMNKALEILMKKFPKTPSVLFYVDGTDKLYVSCYVPKDSNTWNAGDFIKDVCSKCGGSGGGNQTKAQGQGPEISKLQELTKFTKNYFSK